MKYRLVEIKYANGNVLYEIQYKVGFLKWEHLNIGTCVFKLENDMFKYWENAVDYIGMLRHRYSSDRIVKRKVIL